MLKIIDDRKMAKAVRLSRELVELSVGYLELVAKTEGGENELKARKELFDAIDSYAKAVCLYTYWGIMDETDAASQRFIEELKGEES